MSHTPYVQSRLAEAQRLRTIASQISGYVDRQYGAFGYVNTSEADSLRRQAQDIEASVLIPVRQLPNFSFHVRDCTAALHAAERARVMASVGPRLRAALEDIARMGQPGCHSCSLWPPKPINRTNA